MKRLFVLVPAIALGLFLLNSFVIKEKEATKKTTTTKKQEARNFLDAVGVKNIVLRSADGGQTWQDISMGLPEKLQREGVWRDGLLADDSGLILRAANGLYHNEPNSTTSFWTRENFRGNQRNIAAVKNGILAYNIRGQFLKKLNGRSDWSPVYTNFQEQAVRIDKTVDWMYRNYKEREVRSFFETRGGTVFISSNTMLFRSADNGKTWKQVHVGDGRMKLAEHNGVLLSTSMDGILRSTDDGQTWDQVISEGGAGIVVESIDGGFAAIVYDVIAQRNGIRISMDSGKTWNVIGEELQPSWSSLLMQKIGLLNSASNILSIKQMGKYLVCGRADGIFRSPDMGKTWQKMPLPDVPNSGFSLSVSGDVIYIMPNKGC